MAKKEIFGVTYEFDAIYYRLRKEGGNLRYPQMCMKYVTCLNCKEPDCNWNKQVCNVPMIDLKKVNRSVKRD